MYKKVVVPLDGSKLAEVALTHLDNIAKDNPEILLISITEKIKGEVPGSEVYEQFVPEKPVREPPPTMGVFQSGVVYSSAVPGVQEIPMTMGKMAKTAGDYLYKIADSLAKKDFNVTATVLAGHPAEEIVRFAEERSADLIIMASRGKSGFSRWDLGNIAEKVIRATKVPVMLIKPAPDFKETKPKRRGVAL